MEDAVELAQQTSSYLGKVQGSECDVWKKVGVEKGLGCEPNLRKHDSTHLDDAVRGTS
jgi:hypothetical protein